MVYLIIKIKYVACDKYDFKMITKNVLIINICCLVFLRIKNIHDYHLYVFIMMP